MNNSEQNYTLPKGFGQLPADQFDAEYLRLIKADLENARVHRLEMPAEAKRGLTDETIDHFNLLYLPAWINTKSRAEWNCGVYVDKDGNPKKSLPPPSERIIIPTASGLHFNAVATQAARYKMQKDFWKQHAGEMELFCDANALNADIIFIVEGELDVATIWQVSGGKIAVVAILGCANWKKTLLPKLPELQGKKFVLLLDADAAGKKNAKRLLDELLNRGYPAISKTLYDLLYPNEQKTYSKKIDANNFLTDSKLGGQYLYLLIQKRILENENLAEEFTKAEEEIKQRKIAAQEKAARQANTEISTPNTGTDDGGDREEIKLILKDFVHAKDLIRDEWWSVGAILYRYGFSLEDFKAWSDDGDPRYDENRCEIEWNCYEERAKDLKDDEGYKIGTLINLAKRNGYTPKRRDAKLPIELVLPAGFEIRGNSIVFVDSKKDPPKIFTAALTLILPTKKFICASGGGIRYEVKIRLPNGNWTSATVPARTLQDPSKIYELTEHDAIVGTAKTLTAYFSKILALPENTDIIPTVMIYNRPGWHGDKFIYPVADESDSYRVERNGIDYNSIFKTRGDKDEWLAKFWKIVNGKQGALKRIVIGACLLAPMLEVIEILNPQFNLWATSNFAKTPLLKFGMSIYGDPSEGAMLRTWASTAKNMLTMSAGFNGLPLLVDEGETMSKKTQAELSEYVYSFSSGIIGQANKRNGDVRATEQFHGVRFSTAERPLHDTSDKRGAYKRLIDLHVAEELFDDAFAHDLHKFCKRHHGHFGRQWIKYIEDNKDTIRDDFDKAEKRFAEDGFTRDGLHSEFKSVDATNARSIIACAVAYQHFRVCLELDDQFHFCDARDDAVVILAELPTVDDISDVTRSIRLLASWVAENPRRFITPQKHQDGTPIDGDDRPAETFSSTVGKKFANGDIAFFANAFRNIVAEIGLPSYEKVLCDLYDADYLDCKGSRDKCKVIKIDGKPQRAYVVKSEAFSVEDGEDS